MKMSKFGFREDFNPDDRFVKQEEITFVGVKFLVSTIDLGLDHGYDGKSLYYETMIFSTGTGDEKFCERYTTREEALKGHEKIILDIANDKYYYNDDSFERVDD